MHIVAVVAAGSSARGSPAAESDLAARLAAAGELREAGPIALVRLGNGDRLGKWLRSLPRPTARLMTASADTLPATLDRLQATGLVAVVLDVPAGFGDDLTAILSSADLVAVRVAPRPEAVPAAEDLANTLVRCDKPFFFVADGVGGRGLSDAVALALANRGTVCPILVPRHRQACQRGSHGREAAEMETDAWAAPLWSYVRDRLARLSEPEAEAPPPVPAAIQRRRLPRWRVKWAASLTSGDRQISGRLADISGGGVSVVTDAPLRVGESVGLAIGSLGGCGATVVHGSGSSFGLCFDLDPDQQQRLGQQLAQLVSGSGGNGSAIAEATTEPAPAAMGHTAAASARAVVVDPKWLADLPSPAANGERQGAPVAPPDAAIRGKTIVLGNLKGGTGKTTLAMHLSVALLRAGYTVGCVDLDSGQATLSRYLQNRLSFARDRGMDLPMPAVHLTPPADDGELRARLGDLKGRADVILVDTPGGNTPLSRAAHEAADLLITPINDSFVDVDVLARLAADSLAFADLGPYGELIRQIRATKRENGASPLAWIVIRNRLSALDARNKRDMHDALCHLAHRLDFELAAGLSERVLYRELFLHGLTVLDLRTEDTGIPLTLSHVAARQELRTLLQHVLAD